MPQFSTYASVTSLDLTDTFLCLQSGVVKQATIEDMKDQVSDASRWSDIDSSKWTATPANDSQITMSDTSDVQEGSPLRVTQGGTARYFLVHTVTSNTTISVHGPDLGATSIDSMAVGKPEQVVTMSLYVAGYYADGTTTSLLEDDMESFVRWCAPTAYLVAVQMRQEASDSTSEPVVDVLINGSGVITDNSSAGKTVPGAGSWSYASGVEDANYDINYDEDIELSVTTAGGNGDAADLNVILVFVYG